MNAQRLEKIKNLVSHRQLDLTVVLENVIDLHNMGAVLRTCDAVGIAEIYMIYSENRYRPKRFKVGKNTSGGARKWVDVRLYMDYDQAIQDIKSRYEHIWATQLDDASTSIYDMHFTESVALLFGNEKLGLSQRALASADKLIYIPQWGMVQSLNISVACAVCLYEAQRQRHLAGYYSQHLADDRVELLEDYIERSENQHSGDKVLFIDPENQEPIKTDI